MRKPFVFIVVKTMRLLKFCSQALTWEIPPVRMRLFSFYPAGKMY